jgi:hypothetical protein
VYEFERVIQSCRRLKYLELHFNRAVDHHGEMFEVLKRFISYEGDLLIAESRSLKVTQLIVRAKTTNEILSYESFLNEYIVRSSGNLVDIIIDTTCSEMNVKLLCLA